MTFYEEMRDVATEVLREFKQGEVKYVKLTPGTGPRDEPGPAVETLYDVDAAVRGVQFRYIDRTNIVATDLQLTMAVRSDVTPDMLGFVIADGVRYKIKACLPIPPVGVTVAHKLIFGK